MCSPTCNVFYYALPHTTWARSAHNHPQVVARNASWEGTFHVFCVLWGVSLRTDTYITLFLVVPPCLIYECPIQLFFSRSSTCIQVGLIQPIVDRFQKLNIVELISTKFLSRCFFHFYKEIFDMKK